MEVNDPIKPHQLGVKTGLNIAIALVKSVITYNPYLFGDELIARIDERLDLYQEHMLDPHNIKKIDQHQLNKNLNAVKLLKEWLSYVPSLDEIKREQESLYQLQETDIENSVS